MSAYKNPIRRRRTRIAHRTSKRGPVIAIDGPAGSGKSTISRLLAQKLNFTYIDTGAMYRAVALKAYEQGIDSEDEDVLRKFCSNIHLHFHSQDSSSRVFIDGEDYSEKIREQFVGPLSSTISSKRVIRDAMVKLQHSLAEQGYVIIEGRDIGTVVFPDAEVKFYLDASPEVRGKRRYQELKEKGGKDSLDEIIAEVKARDRRDSTREHAPLKKADDAISIDTSTMDVHKVLSVMLKTVRERLLTKGFTAP